MNNIVIGFTGNIGSGKSTAAEALRSIANTQSSHIEFSDPIIEVANSWMGAIGSEACSDDSRLIEPFGTALGDVYGGIVPDVSHIDFSQLSDYLKKRIVMPDALHPVNTITKPHHRELLQWIGHQAVTFIDLNFWSKAVESAILNYQKEGAELVTVCGIRYPSDADMIHARTAGVIAKINRPTTDDIHQRHASEIGIPPEMVNLTIENSDTLHALSDKMSALWTDIRDMNVHKRY